MICAWGTISTAWPVIEEEGSTHYLHADFKLTDQQLRACKSVAGSLAGIKQCRPSSLPGTSLALEFSSWLSLDEIKTITATYLHNLQERVAEIAASDEARKARVAEVKYDPRTALAVHSVVPTWNRDE
jgi:hypothetical protein